MTVLELNDLVLRLYIDGKLRDQSVGMVFIDGKTLRFGAEARAQSRLHPNEVQARYFERMSTGQLRRSYRPVARHADLVFHHLAEFAAEVEAPLVVAVADDMSAEQRALLAGVAQSLDLPLHAMVGIAVASARAPQVGRRLLHLDMHLNRMVLCELDQGAQLRTARAHSFPQLGWLQFMEAFAESVAHSFVAHTRFDPLHDASLEQSLHDQLEDWLASQDHGETTELSLSSGGRLYRADVSQTILLRGAAALYSQLVEDLAELIRGAPATLLLSDRVARLPQLAAQIHSATGCEVVHLPPDAAARGVEELILDAPGTEVAWVAARDWFSETELQAHTREAPGEPATHYLLGATAYSLPAHGEWMGESRCLSIDRSNGIARVGELTQPCYLDRRELSVGEALLAGQRLRLGSAGVEVLLIRVEE